MCNPQPPPKDKSGSLHNRLENLGVGQKTTTPANLNTNVGIWWDSDFPSATGQQASDKTTLIPHTSKNCGKAPSWEDLLIDTKVLVVGEGPWKQTAIVAQGIFGNLATVYDREQSKEVHRKGEVLSWGKLRS
jgi:hypothetical protein